MSIGKDFAEFIKVLEDDGFRKNFGDDDCWIYTKQVSADRVVDVQLWADGFHRASFMFKGQSGGIPTDFTHLESMHAAIQHEITRKPEGVILPSTFEVMSFATTKEMTDWLANESSITELKAKYPPPRYSADLRLIERKIIITDKGA